MPPPKPGLEWRGREAEAGAWLGPCLSLSIQQPEARASPPRLRAQPSSATWEGGQSQAGRAIGPAN